MKDFDFDELDRAVNSVLSKKQQAASDNDNGSQQTAAAVLPVPANDEPVDAAADTPPELPTSDLTASPQAMPDDTDGPADVVAVQGANDDEPNPVDEPSHDENNVPESSTTDSDSGYDDTPMPAPETAEPSSAPEPPAEQTESIQPAEPAGDATSSYEEAPIEPAPEASDVADETATDSDTLPSNISAGATIPQKRGRFMDMVHPSADMAQTHKPMPVRSGVTLQPSADFSLSEDAAPVPADATATDTPESSVNPLSEGEEVPEPVTSEQIASDEISDETSSSTPAPDVTDETAAESVPVAESIDEPAASSAQPVEAFTSSVSEVAATPFIPDVPVEKRPLNPQGAENGNGEENDTVPAVSALPTPQTETDNELTTEVVETEPNTGDTDTPVSSEPAPGGAPYIAPQYKAVEEKSDHDTHPVFDKNSIQQPLHQDHALATPAHSSHFTIIIIVAVLFLVGATIGVLYFLYGQR